MLSCARGFRLGRPAAKRWAACPAFSNPRAVALASSSTDHADTDVPAPGAVQDSARPAASVDADTGPQAGGLSAARESQQPTFTSARQASAYYRNLPNWTPASLNHRCLTRAAWLDVLRTEPAFAAAFPRWYERYCLFLSLGITPEHARTLLTARDADRYTVSVASLKAKIAYLHDRLALQRPEIAALLRVHSRVLDYSVDGTWEPRVAFFVKYFDCSEAELGRVIRRHPRLLWAHFEYDINVKVKLLTGLVGDPKAVVSMLRKQPGILALSEVTIMDKTKEMVTELELTETEQLARVLRAAPSLLMRDLACLDPVVRMLRAYIPDAATVQRIIVAYPAVLTLSVESLDAKLEFLLEEARVSAAAVAACPLVLGMSLRHRVVPRWAALRAALPAGAAVPALGSWLCSSDATFERRYGVLLDSFR